jgi:hypothetical protein
MSALMPQRLGLSKHSGRRNKHAQDSGALASTLIEVCPHNTNPIQKNLFPILRVASKRGFRQLHILTPPQGRPRTSQSRAAKRHQAISDHASFMRPHGLARNLDETTWDRGDSLSAAYPWRCLVLVSNPDTRQGSRGRGKVERRRSYTQRLVILQLHQATQRCRLRWCLFSRLVNRTQLLYRRPK